MEYQALTGLSWGQLTRLNILVYAEIRSLTRENAKKPPAVGLLDSVAMVVMLMRRNVTQAFAGGFSGAASRPSAGDGTCCARSSARCSNHTFPTRSRWWAAGERPW